MSGKKESNEEKEPSEEQGAPTEGGQPEVVKPTIEPETRKPAEGEFEALVKRNEELLSRLKYLQADFENLQKRVQRDRMEMTMNAQEGVLRGLLPILDDLDKAVEAAAHDREGLALLRQKLSKVLGEYGLIEIPAEGQKFDPFIHEAVEYQDDGKLEDGAIKDVIRKGYRCNMRVLRPALVVVVKNEGEKNA